ncbi:hypothetical protein ACH40F_52990 [Streptomyces sp. NPDC020794]|uniref:hypothetical protein n=1 Tax=unclassified Streptomyces TaxID=2593676 RepID=UPI0036E711C6
MANSFGLLMGGRIGLLQRGLGADVVLPRGSSSSSAYVHRPAEHLGARVARQAAVFRRGAGLGLCAGETWD